MRIRWSFYIVLVLVLISGQDTDAEPQRLYRYKNAHGTIVIDDHIPPEYAQSGYEILNRAGQLIEAVPKQLTQQEINSLSDEEKAKRRALEDQEKLRAWDVSLLSRYSDVGDLEAARDREVKELNVRLSILRGNVFATKSQIEQQRTKAANLERSGREVPQEDMENIALLKKQIEVAENDITIRLQEIEEVRAAYQKDIDRFSYLIEVKGYRR